MKKMYAKPVLRVVKIQQMQMLCQSKKVTGLGKNNADLQWGGGDTGSARSRSVGADDWDED